MPKRGKKYIESKAKTLEVTSSSFEEAVKISLESSYAKFDETVDLSVRLGVDPRKADQMVRGAVVLPNGLGKDVRVLVFAKGEKAMEATEAGADFVGADDLVEKIKGGWFDFDTAIATPDMMGTVGKIGKLLGPRSLMPNPKVGTVTLNVKDTVDELKKGKVEFRTDKGANLHVPVGKVSFDSEKLRENIMSLVDTVNRMKPPASKGQYMRNMVISSTMGPGVKIDIASLKE